MENKSKLAALLLKVEATVSTDSGEDTFVSLNDSLAKNLRSAYGAGNGDCYNNRSCDNNGVCYNNDTCNGNGTCKQPKAVVIGDVPAEGDATSSSL